MQNRQRTLMFRSTIMLVLMAAALGSLAYAQHRATSKIKAATETGQTTAIRETADTQAGAQPDVTVNGQHIDVPASGTTSQAVSGGGRVDVTTNQGSTATSSTSPDGSVHVQISTSNGNAAGGLDGQVQNNSSVQSSSWSHVNVFSNGTSSVNVHN